MSVKTLWVRLKSRSILEPGCRTVDPGHVLEIPSAHFDPQHHEKVDPPAGWVPAAEDPPAEAAAPEVPADSPPSDQDDIALFEDPPKNPQEG